MSLAAEKQLEQIGAICACEDHDYEMIHELDARLSLRRRNGFCLDHAEGNSLLHFLSRQLKRRELDSPGNINQHVTDDVEDEIATDRC